MILLCGRGSRLSRCRLWGLILCILVIRELMMGYWRARLSRLSALVLLTFMVFVLIWFGLGVL